MSAGAPAASTPAVRRSMQGNRSRDTAPERRLRSEMHRLGLRFRKHSRPLPAERFTADAVFPVERVAVFLHGCYWHRCAEHSRPPVRNGAWWAEKLLRNVERDARCEAALRAAGWLPVVVWEHEDPRRAALRVRRAVRRRRP